MSLALEDKSSILNPRRRISLESEGILSKQTPAFTWTPWQSKICSKFLISEFEQVNSPTPTWISIRKQASMLPAKIQQNLQGDRPLGAKIMRPFHMDLFFTRPNPLQAVQIGTLISSCQKQSGPNWITCSNFKATYNTYLNISSLRMEQIYIHGNFRWLTASTALKFCRCAWCLL